MKKLIIAAALATAVVSPAFAQASKHVVHAPTGATSVYAEGRYVGRDPDPQVRFDMQREAPSYLGED